jgi:hypothetical protein
LERSRRRAGRTCRGARMRPARREPAFRVPRAALRALDEAPRQGSEGAPDAWLEVNPTFARGLFGIAMGDEAIVVTWLHRADRDVPEVHPRGDPEVPLAGVFTTRSPHRPNPLGLHRVTVREISGTRLRIDRSRPSMARRSSTSSRFSSTAPMHSASDPSERGRIASRDRTRARPRACRLHIATARGDRAARGGGGREVRISPDSDLIPNPLSPSVK